MAAVIRQTALLSHLAKGKGLAFTSRSVRKKSEGVYIPRPFGSGLEPESIPFLLERRSLFLGLHADWSVNDCHADWSFNDCKWFMLIGDSVIGSGPY